MNRALLTELNTITDQLPHAAQQLAKRVNRLVEVAKRPTPGVCPGCLEDVGWCTATGGTNLCADYTGMALLVAETNAAPTVRVPTATGEQS